MWIVNSSERILLTSAEVAKSGGGGGNVGDRAAFTVVILVQSGFPWQDMTSTNYRTVLLPIKV